MTKTKFSLKNCKVGDILITRNGDKAKILWRSKYLIVRSAWANHGTMSEMLTIEDAELRDWRLEQRDGRYPMTKKEAESMLGVEIIN